MQPGRLEWQIEERVPGERVDSFGIAMTVWMLAPALLKKIRTLSGTPPPGTAV
jgi:hypothetical protein